MRVTASPSGILSSFVERGLRSSVGDCLTDRTTSASAFALAASAIGLWPSDLKHRLASSTAPHTPSRFSGVTAAPGHSLRSSRVTRAPKLGCLSRMLPLSTNCTWLRGLTSLRAQAAASRARRLAALASISRGILSSWPRVVRTSAARLAIPGFSAACAQSIRSVGSFRCSARSNRRPNGGQHPSWS